MKCVFILEEEINGALLLIFKRLVSEFWDSAGLWYNIDVLYIVVILSFVLYLMYLYIINVDKRNESPRYLIRPNTHTL